ncbi:MAG TPA: hypothetical protein VI754_08165 [Bacteriovoracaceae bacterium]|nr:hypothetical protein [Bacteriovoracaceae bacterium]
MKLLYFLSFLFLSCAFNQAERLSAEGASLSWDILDESVLNSWSKEMLLSKLGPPESTIKEKASTPLETLIFLNKTTHNQEWAFRLDGNNKVVSVVYLPGPESIESFSLEIVKKRWEKFNCKAQEKQSLSPGLISTTRYLACDGKRTIEYDKHDQISYIGIEK